LNEDVKKEEEEEEEDDEPMSLFDRLKKKDYKVETISNSAEKAQQKEKKKRGRGHICI
jgi:hypothetical protein